jgi:hypothetical protein
MVPTVERGLRLVVFCSMEMAGERPSMACVGGKGFDVAALALGVDGVEGERTLARTGEAGDDGEGVAGDAHADVAQIMLARAPHRDVCDGHGEI